ncbi:MAG: VOC family protein, partial [Ferruginibacter sp.]
MTHEIYPCLWFDNEAKSATTFYCECFHPSKIMDENSIALNFSIWDFKFLALNGGPYFKINPSISFFVHHDSDEALTTLWKKLSEGGTVMMALDKYPWSEKYGWCQDKYGVNWQLMLQPGGKEKITPSLMFTQANAGKANEAIEFYTRIFKDSEIEDISRYEKGEHDVEGYIKYS